jgi:hypothetical protein
MTFRGALIRDRCRTLRSARAQATVEAGARSGPIACQDVVPMRVRHLQSVARVATLDRCTAPIIPKPCGEIVFCDIDASSSCARSPSLLKPFSFGSYLLSMVVSITHGARP